MCGGRLFYRRTVATKNVLSPTVDNRVRRTSREVDEAELLGVGKNLFPEHLSNFADVCVLYYCHYRPKTAEVKQNKVISHYLHFESSKFTEILFRGTLAGLRTDP